MKNWRSVVGGAVGIALCSAALVVGPPAVAENSCNGQAYVSYSSDHAWVKDPTGLCQSVAVRHHYFAVGYWYVTPVKYVYNPTKGVGYGTSLGAQLHHAQACAAVYYPSWNCNYGSWEGPITSTSYVTF